MPDVLEETTGKALTSAQAKKRISDWEQRIKSLYEQIKKWLPPGWTAHANLQTRMLEEPMREAGLPAFSLPVLTILKNDVQVATIEPRGLWIIGANGRLDLRYGSEHYLIVDEANNFEKPQWKLASITNRQTRKPFNKALLQSIL